MKPQSNLLAATLMGGIMGSAVTAAYMLLNDADNRKRLFGTLDSFMESSGLDDVIQQGRERVNEVARDAKDVVNEGGKKVREVRQAVDAADTKKQKGGENG